jgi:IS5 family transposase
VPGGATHDLTLVRQTNLLARLVEDEAAMLDKGYDGIQNDYPEVRLYQLYKARRDHPLADEQKTRTRGLARYRIVVEHTTALLNKFQVLVQVFRHARTSHLRTPHGACHAACHAVDRLGQPDTQIIAEACIAEALQVQTPDRLSH